MAYTFTQRTRGIWLFISFSLVFKGTNPLYRWFPSPSPLAKLLLLKSAQIISCKASIPAQKPNYYSVQCKNIAKHNNMETTTTTCRICKNATANNHNHYGSNSVCHSCRAFFMRSVKRYQVQKTLEKLQLESFTTSKNGLSFVTSKGLSENVSDQNKLFCFY